jgi:hypothetical protein
VCSPWIKEAKEAMGLSMSVDDMIRMAHDIQQDRNSRSICSITPKKDSTPDADHTVLKVCS